ncbi:RING-H2 group F1A, putative isoform 2 [Theobroma cacao]|uniref:RING-type E3 ubiquitin transferase n=1 Tax=Theobroma cacao TaxID=3641 RepID=A0A061EKL7_THECC|nr:RING-H2 group F1A, putative isoform 2 [Theobroma cacao]
MADFTSSPSAAVDSSCSMLEKPIALMAASSSSPPSSSYGGVLDDGSEDGCSICLEPFSAQDPATVTSCRHEYHLQCILEWSQRSKECPICWQSFVLKDPASQELLDTVRIERHCRSRNPSPAVLIDFHHFHDGFGAEEDASHSDDSDFDERILQHLAAAASRARYVRRRERQRSFGLDPSQVLFFTSPEHMLHTQQTNPTSPDECQNLRQPQVDTPHRPSSSETFSFTESIKSKWSIASARYKESISKGTRGLKEKLLARNNSVKELSKGVQREMSAGIAGVAKMIERLDIATKRPGASIPVSGGTGGTSNILFKGKGVQENVIAQGLNKNCAEFNHGLNSEEPSYSSCTIPGKVEVSRTQRGQ